MGINIRSKSCPNCGANLKFNIDDDSVICRYCGSQIQIEHQKKQIYIDNMNINVKGNRVKIDGLDGATVNRLYINKSGEMVKWLLCGAFSFFSLIFGIFMLFDSNPIYGIMMITASILAIVPSNKIIFLKKSYIKVILVVFLFFFGFLVGIDNEYKIPSEFQGKYVSDTTDMTVEIKGNKIIVNDNGKITKEKIYCWEQTYGSISYYTIKVNNGEYNFKLYYKNSSRKYKFYDEVHYRPNNYFYNVKSEDKYYHYEDEEWN